MALSRRKFTKEVKVVAIQRLNAATSVAEVARAFEVNPNLPHRWRKEFRHGPGMLFREAESDVGMKPKSLNWKGRLASRRWRSIF
jgi:transposase-like protein